MNNDTAETNDNEPENRSLKQCDFCGNASPSPVCLNSPISSTGLLFYVLCDACGATGPKKETNKESRAAWNARVYQETPHE